MPAHFVGHLEIAVDFIGQTHVQGQPAVVVTLDVSILALFGQQAGADTPVRRKGCLTVKCQTQSAGIINQFTIRADVLDLSSQTLPIEQRRFEEAFPAEKAFLMVGQHAVQTGIRRRQTGFVGAGAEIVFLCADGVVHPLPLAILKELV
ncbi:hypothetical protein D3C78_1206370 [compost metagenome]